MRTTTIKSLAAVALTAAGSALVVGFQVPDAPVAATTTTATTTTTGPTTSGTGSTGVGTTSTTATVTPAPTSSTTTTTAAAATYADGTWTGAAIREPWGTFQVQAVVSDGTITDVVVVSAPQDGHSDRINAQAVPILTQAAVAAQSAEIDLLSGATWTSQSYTASLQAALDQAAAAAQAAA